MKYAEGIFTQINECSCYKYVKKLPATCLYALLLQFGRGYKIVHFNLIESLGPISDTTLDTFKSIRTRKTVELNVKPSHTQPNMSTQSHPVVYDIVIYCDSAQ